VGKQAPQTTKGATQRLIDFSSIPDVQDAPSLTSKERLEYDYLKKRDPMREFFSLALKSVQINSPHMTLIQDMKETGLWEKQAKEKVPFFKWYTWLEATINQEVMKCLFLKKQKLVQKEASSAPVLQKKKTLEKKAQVKEDLNKFMQE